MVNQHKHKGRYIRQVADEEWADFETAAAETNTDRSALVAAFIRWYIGRPGAKLPQRPEPKKPK